ncbi:MAG: hypothetical protein KGJ37_03640, partial [Verrucomicrobiota bacterium]|nr:hypothetical protein [Verrucomicrobiota bacterium]
MTGYPLAGLMKKILSASICFLFATYSVYALDSARAVKDYKVKEWLATDGLPYPSIRCVAQSGDGYLWVGSRTGLARFDGKTFTIYRKANLPILPNDSITALMTMANGTLWIGTEQGVLCYHEGSWFRPDLGPELANANILAIFEERPGSILLTITNRLFRYRDGRCEAVTSDDKKLFARITTMLRSSDGKLLLAGRGLLEEEPNGKFREILPKTEHKDEEILAVAAEPSGALWVGSAVSLWRIDGDMIQQFTTQDGLPSNAIRSLLRDSDGNIWIGTSNGLARYTNGQFQQVIVRRGETLSHVLCLFEDLEKNLWAGTDNGLLRIQDVKFANITQRDGLSVNSVLCVLEGRDGTRWVGTLGGGLARITPQGYVQNLGVADGLLQDSVISLAEDATGGLWIGYYLKGISYYKDGKFTDYTPPGKGSNNARARGFAIDKQGVVWTAIYGKLWRFSQGAFESVPLGPGLKDVRALHIDSAGGIWVGCAKAIGRLYEGNWTIYPKPAKLYKENTESF